MAAQSDGCWFDFVASDRHFQESVGPTPADDPNEVIGLSLSQRLWGGKTLPESVAAQPELKAAGATGLAGSATVATYNTATGVGTVTRVDGANQSSVTLSVTLGRTYRLDLSVSTGTVQIRDGTAFMTVMAALAATTRQEIFVTPATSTITLTSPSGTAGFTVQSLKEVSRYVAAQPTTSLKPKVQATGAEFDGSDDNLLTTYRAGSGANFILARVSLPATLSGTPVIGGAAVNATDRFYLALIGSTGVLGAGAGSSSPGSLQGGPDLRGRTVVVGISAGAGTVRLFADGQQVAEAAYTGTLTQTVPMMVGALNTNGTATNFFGGSVKAVAVGRQLLDLATFNQIASQL
jgi:hypothetical protein